MSLVALYIRGQGTDVLLPREVQASCGESPVLVHHVRHLGGEVVGSCHEHLSHVATPGGRLFWAAREAMQRQGWAWAVGTGTLPVIAAVQHQPQQAEAVPEHSVPARDTLFQQ